jgi:Fe2+ or Zn2+ uptake regulation protein
MVNTTSSEQSTLPVVRLIDLLDQLEAQGLLSRLYQAGALTLATLNHREAYLHYCALLASPHYLDQPTRAVEATAAAFRMGKRTVYRALDSMQQAVRP